MVEPIWGEGQDGGAPLFRFLPIWCEGGQDGGLPSWRRMFGVENKMADLPSGGFYLFGVEDTMMEAHHHGGACLGGRTRWRSSCVEVWGEGGQDGGPPSWWNQFDVEDKMAELLCGGLG